MKHVEGGGYDLAKKLSLSSLSLRLHRKGSPLRILQTSLNGFDIGVVVFSFSFFSHFGTGFSPDSCRIPCLSVCHCNSANSFWRFYICSSVQPNSRLKKSNKMQQYVDIYLLLNYCTCFGRPSRPSSGVHKTTVAASGTVLCTPDDGLDGRPKRV